MRMHFFRDPLVNSGVWSFEQKNLGPRITDAEARAYFDPTGNDAKMTQMYMESCERVIQCMNRLAEREKAKHTANPEPVKPKSDAEIRTKQMLDKICDTLYGSWRLDFDREILKKYYGYSDHDIDKAREELNQIHSHISNKPFEQEAKTGDVGTFNSVIKTETGDDEPRSTMIKSDTEGTVNKEIKPKENMDNLVDHAGICGELTSIYRKKNADYGNSFSRAVEKYGLVSALTRISDKFNRLESLILHKEQEVKDESVQDTLLDLANYCIMTVMEIRKNGIN